MLTSGRLKKSLYRCTFFATSSASVLATPGAHPNPERYPGAWVETFVDLPNKTYAGPGFIYDPIAKDFSPPPPTVE